MENIFEQIKNTSDLEPKKDLRKKIRNKILVIKLQRPIFLTFFLLIMSLLFLTVHSYLRIFESEASSVINAFISDFEFSYSYLSSFGSGMQEVLPLRILTIWLINFSLVAIFTKFIHYYRHELFNINN
jgi:predicted neutral ceramidase superfamily lipid hydrolase